MSNKFAFIQNIPLNLENDLSNINKLDIRNRFNEGVTFHDFTGTEDLFKQIYQLMGNNMLEIINSSYDSQTVTQAVYIENDSHMHQKMIILKRNLRQDDSYTFLEFQPNLPELYEYVNVTYDDLVEMVYQKYVHCGIIVNSNGSVHNIDYIYKDDINDPNYGNIIYKKCTEDSLHEIKYLHLINIMQQLKDGYSNENEEMDSDKFNKLLEDKMNELNCTHLYSQRDFSMGTFNCYCPVFGENKNEIVSKILGDTVGGNVIITLETKLNNDERLLNLSDTLFQSILQTIQNSNYVPKNKHYFNIYHELFI
jgi:hypothetical protein